MDKITFLRELEQGLSVLQSDELEDIKIGRASCREREFITV